MAAQLPTTTSESWPMFDRIAPTYDLLNRLLSFRQDVAWRRRVARNLPEGADLNLLDLATGTGDVLLALVRPGARVKRGVGLDMSANMLARAARKFAASKNPGQLTAFRGDACAIAFESNAFDAVTMAFGIRNVPDVSGCLREAHRVLRSGGRALILEFSLPPNRLMRGVYLFYFRHVLPGLGRIVSGDAEAYRYLNTSVESFPYGEEFCALMRQAGFESVRAEPLTFGIATLYIGEK